MSRERLVSRLLPVVMLFAAGCARHDVSDSVQDAGKQTESLLIKAGGTGGARSDPFVVRGRGVRVEYRLQNVPHGGTATFVVESFRSDTQYNEVTRQVRRVSMASLSGSFDFSLVTGEYRLRVDGDAPWTVSVFDLPADGPSR